MADKLRHRWPVWLFIATAFSGIISTAATIYYYRFTTILKNQEHALEEKRAQYQKEIEDLKKRLIVTQTVTTKIPIPVVTMKRQCIGLFGSNNVCTEVPESRIEQREIQTVVPTEDPKIKEQLDLKLKELQALSDAAVATQHKQVDWKELVETIRRLVAPIISILVSVASLFIILSKQYKAESEKWAFGSLGTILGFWLK